VLYVQILWRLGGISADWEGTLTLNELQEPHTLIATSSAPDQTSPSMKDVDMRYYGRMNFAFTETVF
jgi:hypothetical protein